MSKLIEIEDLLVQFKRKSAKLTHFRPEYFSAVDHVSFSIEKGETFGLVGESGSGKSTIGRAVLGYLPPAGGRILYEGKDITRLNEKERLPYQRKMQSVFQDPYSSLDPSMNVRQIIEEPMDIHRVFTGSERKKKVEELLEAVGLTAQDSLRYPFEFSGGQRQRISIARALSISPDFIVCDEPISALDVSLQAQIVFMLRDLQKQLGLTYLFISHQLQITQKICDHIAVLYLGSVMELGTSDQIFFHPRHPYTRMLISSILEADPDLPGLEAVPADSGNQGADPAGCKFSDRCPHARPECSAKKPPLKETEPGHYSSCILSF